MITQEGVDLAAGLPEITPDIFTSASAIVGIRGSGKTNNGVVLTEQAIGHGVPVVVIDPTGVWWGLKSSADGESPGLPVYVFGGEHGDVPLEVNAGEIIARFVVENRVPIVLDLSHMRKDPQREFVRHFAETLYDLKARFRDPLLVVIDEVARFCPQRVEASIARCVGAIEDIVSLGRSRGLGCVLIGQRPATINKNVLTQSDNLFAMRTVGAQDRRALDEWVSEAQGDQRDRDELVQNMPALPQGVGYFWSPALFNVFRRVAFNARQTFDSSRTPKVGEQRIEAKAFAEVDLDALRGELASAVSNAKHDDPKFLRSEILRLEKALEVATEATAVPAITDDQLIDIQRLLNGVNQASSDLYSAWTPVREAMTSIASARFSREAGLVLEAFRVPDDGKVRSIQTDAPSRRKRAEAMTAISLEIDRPQFTGARFGSPERRLGEALAMRYPLRTSIAQLGAFSRYKPAGGAFRTAMKNLRDLGFVEVAGENVSFTEAGLKEFGVPVSNRPTGRVLRDHVRGAMTEPERRLFDAVIQRGKEGISVADLALTTRYNPAGGAFRSALATLRKNELIRQSGVHVVLEESLR